MATEERVIISVELDRQKAGQEAQKLEQDLFKLRTRQRELNKSVKEGTISQEDYAKEIVAVKTQIKQKSADQRQAIKVSQAEEGSLNALKARLAQVTKERNSVNQATTEGVKRASQLDDEILDLNNRLKANEEASGQFFRNVGNYTNSIIAAADATTIFGVNVGQARGAVVAATSGIQGSNVALKAFKVALASTGIGAIIVALGSLVTFFTRTQRGADGLNKVLAGIGATVDVITDRFSILGEGLLALFQGEFSDAVGFFRSAVTGIGDEIINESQAAFALESRGQDLAKQRAAFLLREAELRRDIARLRTEGEDDDRGALERQGLLANALEKLDTLTKERVALQREEVEILAAKQALGENLIADDEALFAARAELVNIEAQAENERRRLQAIFFRTREEAARGNQDKINEYRLNTEITTLERIGSIQDAFYSDPATDPAVKNAEQVSQLRILAAQKEAQAKKNLAQLESDIDNQVGQTKVENAEQTLAKVVDVTGEQTALGKAAGVAQATASTYVAANKALAAFPPPFSFIAAAATVAKGLLNVGQITGLARGGYVDGPGTSTSDSIPVFLSKGESVINAKSTQMFAPQLSAMNQAGGGRPFSVPNINSGYAQGGIIQSNRNVSDQLQNRQLMKAIQSMPAPVVDLQEFSRAQNRVQYKQNQTSV